MNCYQQSWKYLKLKKVQIIESISSQIKHSGFVYFRGWTKEQRVRIFLQQKYQLFFSFFLILNFQSSAHFRKSCSIQPNGMGLGEVRASWQGVTEIPQPLVIGNYRWYFCCSIFLTRCSFIHKPNRQRKEPETKQKSNEK